MFKILLYIRVKRILQVKKDILLSHLETIVVPVNGIKMKKVIKGKYIHLQVENTVQIYPRIMVCTSMIFIINMTLLVSINCLLFFI